MKVEVEREGMGGRPDKTRNEMRSQQKDVLFLAEKKNDLDGGSAKVNDVTRTSL